MSCRSTSLLPVSGTMPDDVVAALKQILSAKDSSDVCIPKSEMANGIVLQTTKFLNNAGLKIGPISFVGRQPDGANILAQSVGLSRGVTICEACLKCFQNEPASLLRRMVSCVPRLAKSAHANN